MLLSSRGDWDRIVVKYRPNPGLKPKNQSIITEGQRAPRSYPCVAVCQITTSMTDYDRVLFEFVYQTDFI